MNSCTNAYDKLYNNMKNTFTVVNDGCECTLGEYMLKKAKEKKNTSNLPVAAYGRDNAIAAIYSFVNDKLTIKQAPVKDRTIKKFPFRATASAFLTAAVACAFVLTFALIGAKSLDTSVSVANDVSVMEQIPEDAVNTRH